VYLFVRISRPPDKKAEVLLAFVPSGKNVAPPPVSSLPNRAPAPAKYRIPETPDCFVFTDVSPFINSAIAFRSLSL